MEKIRKKRIYMTRDNFLKRAKLKFGDKYDYSRLDYIDLYTHILIECPFHGEFITLPTTHIYKKGGCKKCGNEAWAIEKNRRAKAAFIDKAKKIHGDKYDFSKTVYVTSKEQIEVICKKHGPFPTTPNAILEGKGCNNCGIESSAEKRSLSPEDFLLRAKVVHGDSYDYTFTRYVSSNTPVIVICPKHGKFSPYPLNHLKGHGCLECGFDKTGDGLRKPLDEFIRDARSVHGDKYDYSQVVYTNSKACVDIICPQHGIFPQTPTAHCKGSGCKLCADILNSKGVRRIESWLVSRGIKYEREKTFPNFKSSKKKRQHFRFDFYLPEKNLIIEYDGPQHFKAIEHWGGESAFQTLLDNDKIKEKWANEQGLQILRINFNEMENIDEKLSERLIYNVGELVSSSSGGS